jgi:hypothetical protein
MGTLKGHVAAIEERRPLFKLTQIASEAKVAAFEKSGRR